mgnify:FL=1
MKENKLIAEFMGMTYSDPNDNSVMIQMTPQGNEVVPIESMQYHTSWDWLMPVVREVLTIVDINLVNYFVDELKFCVLDNDIDGAFEEVVEFINYLNKTNNN